MECFDVVCIDGSGKEYHVGVMTENGERAMKSAVESLREGRHIESRAVSFTKVDAI